LTYSWFGIIGTIGFASALLCGCNSTTDDGSGSGTSNASATGVWSGNDSVSGLGVTALINAAGQATFIRGDGVQFTLAVVTVPFRVPMLGRAIAECATKVGVAVNRDGQRAAGHLHRVGALPDREPNRRHHVDGNTFLTNESHEVSDVRTHWAGPSFHKRE
jgi:hypothetical protein